VTTHPIPDPLSLWDKHVEGVLRVLCLALERLRLEGDLPLKEVDLDGRFLVTAHEAYRGLPELDRPQMNGLQPKAEQTPISRRDVGEKWVRTKPDFTWRMQDNRARIPLEFTKDFHIESKRLGRQQNRKRVLTKEYVALGIIRFLSVDHRYGHDVTSGAMIGYVRDSEPSDLVDEVDGYIAATKEYAIPPLGFPRNGSSDHAVMKARQLLNRTEVSPAEFVLHHLWVDLRVSKPGVAG